MTKALIDYGYKHLEPGQPGNNQTYRICGNPTRQETSAPLCQKPAGWGTSHPGAGRCKLHGGSSPSGPASAKWKTGRTAYQFKGRLRQHLALIQDQQQVDADALDLLPELEAQRVLLSLSLDVLAEVSGESDGAEGDSERIEKGDRVGVEEKGTLLKQVASTDIAQFLEKYAGNYDVTKKASGMTQREAVEAVRLITNDIVATVTKIMGARSKAALTRAEMVYFITTMKEAMQRFVPIENQRPYLQYIKKELSGLFEEREEEVSDESEASWA